MALPKNKFRELVFLILYRTPFFKEESDFDAKFYMTVLKTTKSNVEQALEMAKAIQSKLSEIDPLINEASIGYDLERIQSTELTAMRLAIYEMLFDEEVPEKVALKEALRLTKKFSTESAVTFVNGVLDQVYKNKNDPVYSA